jgi:hypothetical protein
MPTNTVFSAAVEGIVDEAAVVTIADYLAFTVGVCYVKRGKSLLDKSLSAYNQAARQSPWLIVRDLDHDARCATELVRMLLPEQAPHMCFRVAVREMEAWFLSDAANFASFIGVKTAAIPQDAEILLDPKEAVLQLAAKSRKRDIRRDMVPENAARREGPAYASRLIEFALYHWDIGAARRTSNSLDRCLRALKRLEQVDFVS